MKLIDLAKKNLEEYIAIKDVLELVAKTQQTPLSLVATFLISQGFETDIRTYEADKYYVLRSDDIWNWGHFQHTNEILSNLADNDDYSDTFEFDEKDILKYLKDTYWKRSELYNLELIKKLSLDFYFRVQDIKNIICNTSIDLKKYENKTVFSMDDVKELLKSGIPSYLPSSQENYFLIDDFVVSSIEFFECDFSGGFEISRDNLIKLFIDNKIVISGFCDLTASEKQQEGNIWDSNYLSILQNEVLDIERLELDIFYVSDEIESLKSQQYPLYFKNKSFTLHEAACLISGYNPTATFGQHTYVNWLKANPDYEEASDFIYSFLRADSAYECLDNNVHIDSYTIKKILTESNIFIDGFNDLGLSKQNLQENKELLERIARLEKELHLEKAHSFLIESDSQLSQSKTVQLKESIAQKDAQIEKLKNDVLRENGDVFGLSMQLNQKNYELKQLTIKNEALQAESLNKAKSQTTQLLEQIFDESTSWRYAPDLVAAIKLWEYIYITNPKEDSHSNKADTWLRNNTGYNTAKKAGSASKIREITAPFINWSTHRDKAHKK